MFSKIKSSGIPFALMLNFFCLLGNAAEITSAIPILPAPSECRQGLAAVANAIDAYAREVDVKTSTRPVSEIRRLAFQTSEIAIELTLWAAHWIPDSVPMRSNALMCWDHLYLLRGALREGYFNEANSEFSRWKGCAANLYPRRNLATVIRVESCLQALSQSLSEEVKNRRRPDVEIDPEKVVKEE